MRLILPSGEYPLAGVWDLSRLTIAETIEFQTGVAGSVVYSDAISRITGNLYPVVAYVLAQGSWDGSAIGMADDPERVLELSWLIWLARHKQGDRQPNGAPLTLAEIQQTELESIRFVLEPGDVPAEPEVEPDPQRPRSGSGRGAKQGGKRKPATTKTSTPQP